MSPFLQIKSLSKQYPGADSYAVDELNFDIQKGEIFSLLGPNGAGKSTTMSMISCLLKPSNGDVLFDGMSTKIHSKEIKRRIGIVPQEIALYETLSARDNLYFWGRMYGLTGKTLANRVDLVLDQVNLGQRAKDKVGTFSGGMKRRINIAASLLHRPDLLILDEPTVGIDPQSRRRILDLVKEFNQEGITVLYTTHYMEEAEELSDRVGIIDHGKLIALGTQKELTRMVGEYDTLRLHFFEGEIVEPLVFALNSLPDIINASTTDHQIIIVVPEAEEVLPSVLGKSNEIGVKIRTIEIEEPNLEAVFLHLTGRALRDI